MDERPEKPAAFLDRDGVLNRDHGYVYKPADLEILPGVFEGLRLLKARGYWLIVITNQSGIARGLFSLAELETFHRSLDGQIKAALGFGLDAYYFCPHHPQGSVPAFAVDCACRKPKPGLLEQAGLDFPIDWTRSVLLGDKPSDIDCAEAQGIKGVQIVNEQYARHRQPAGSLSSLKDLGPLLDVLWT